MATTDVVKEVKSWLTPAMIAVIGFFAKSKLEEIEDAVKLIPSVQNQISVIQANQSAINANYNEFRGEFIQHVDLAAKSEEQITLDKLKKAF